MKRCMSLTAWPAILAAIAIGLSITPTCKADISFQADNLPSSINVQFDAKINDNVTTVVGNLVKDPKIEVYGVGNDGVGLSVYMDANGLKVTQDKTSTLYWTTFTVTPEAGWAFGSIDLKVDLTPNLNEQITTVNLYALDQNGVQHEKLGYGISGNGEHDFNALASNGQQITKFWFVVQANASIPDLHIEDVHMISVEAMRLVPEPSSLAIAGLGTLGLALYGMRRRAR